MENNEDLPKSIVVVLVILAVAISVLGTATVLNELNSLNAAPVWRGTPSQSAKIQLVVAEPVVGQPLATGKVTFTVE